MKFRPPYDDMVSRKHNPLRKPQRVLAGININTSYVDWLENEVLRLGQALQWVEERTLEDGIRRTVKDVLEKGF